MLRLAESAETCGLTTDLSPTFSRKHSHNQRARSNLSGGPRRRAILPAQMHLAKRHLSKHARSRLFAWALAMSMWLFAAITGAIAMRPRHARQRADLDALARLDYLVRGLIIARASELARQRAPKRLGTAYRGRPIATSGLIRALIGSRLRRALTRKDIFEQLRALSDALHALETHAAHLAKRMRRRLTRLAPILTRPCAAAPLRLPTLAHTIANDSS